MGRVKIREQIVRKDRESTIKLAIAMVGTVEKNIGGKNGQKGSIRTAEEAHGIPFSTLRNRIKGSTSRAKSHTKQQLLSPTDEKQFFDR